MRVSIKFGSHFPVLTKLVEMTDGPILELGIGLYSTPYLHWKCFPTKRKLSSFESGESWVSYFKDCRNDYHDVNYIENWDKLEINKFWDIAFIDHDPNERRHIEVRRLANNAKYLILHDSEPEHDSKYMYSEVYPLFKYRFDYTLAKPNTTVLSNFVDLRNFII